MTDLQHWLHLVEAKQQKTEAYRLGRRADAANYGRDSNPYSNRFGEWADWDLGWLDGYTDIGWSKKQKQPRVKRDD